MKSNTEINPAKFLTDLDRQITATERQRDELERSVTGLRAAREAYAQFVLTEATQPRHNGHGTRVDAMKDILAASPEPLSVSAILAELKRRGRVDTKNGVNQSLHYLKRQSLAKNVDRGQWTAVTGASQAA